MNQIVKCQFEENLAYRGGGTKIAQLEIHDDFGSCRPCHNAPDLGLRVLALIEQNSLGQTLDPSNYI